MFLAAIIVWQIEERRCLFIYVSITGIVVCFDIAISNEWIIVLLAVSAALQALWIY